MATVKINQARRTITFPDDLPTDPSPEQARSIMEAVSEALTETWSADYSNTRGWTIYRDGTPVSSTDRFGTALATATGLAVVAFDSPSSPHGHEYAFDVDCRAVVRITATSEAHARNILRVRLDALDVDYRSGDKRLRITEVSAVNNGELFEIDGAERS